MYVRVCICAFVCLCIYVVKEGYVLFMFVSYTWWRKGPLELDKSRDLNNKNFYFINKFVYLVIRQVNYIKLENGLWYNPKFPLCCSVYVRDRSTLM